MIMSESKIIKPDLPNACQAITPYVVVPSGGPLDGMHNKLSDSLMPIWSVAL